MDLNHTERRALGTALTLIGLGLLGRAVLAPGPTDLAWEPNGASGSDLKGLEGAVAKALATEQRSQIPLATDERIDPNTAPVVELRRLPGIGPGLAAEILRERESRPFTGSADLERVAGIGPATLRRLEPYLAFGRPVLEPPGIIQDFGVAAGAGRPSGCDSGALDVNRATAGDLERLPGIGAALAARIVEHRARHGRFPTLGALTDVRGIGPRSLDRLRGPACAGNP